MPETSNTAPFAAGARGQLPAALGLAIALAAGVLMPIQGRINGALGRELGDPVAAALVSFGTGFILLLAGSLGLPAGRAGLAGIRRSIKTRAFPLWYLGAGAVGAFVVYGQALAVPLVGVALFTVAIVTGQTLGSLFVDRIGFGTGRKRPITGLRAIGSVLTVAAVLWAVSPRLGAAQGEGPALMLTLLVPAVGGVFMGFQAAMNGVQAMNYGTPVAATFVNFAVGGALLGVILLVSLPFTGAPNPLPGSWWYYAGGPLGCVVIGVSALLVRHLGVLLTGLGMIAGQLLGSLGIDLLFPAPGAIVNLATIGGTVLTLAAVALASMPFRSVKTRR
ncbi:DMT family transporter [Paeniglutamicibacter cryotolerans]|uniref:Transporter family-2 protein n=1 Tax=Paeniglutamicibacter cryotolerans TaxID=670079 RepID=A0A839QS54_9MICC|nr:DMT family transporter [Paeniglutamicibacter cryotolerans]MBB2996092.1 transporter family-2 protein [Paeniglutamicibacter cryotolerans]